MSRFISAVAALLIAAPALAGTVAMDFPHLTWPAQGQGICIATAPCHPSK